VKPSPQDMHNQHEIFVRQAIARSLLTLPFANLDARDPFGKPYGFYKQLLTCAESGDLPSQVLLKEVISMIAEDASTHELAGNHLKADVLRQWCRGLRLHFTWGQGLVTP
jgi:hypothetical protein